MVNVVRNGRKWGRRLSVLGGFDGAGGLPAWVEEILEAGAVDLYVDNSGFVWSGRFTSLVGGDSRSRSCCFVCGQQWLCIGSSQGLQQRLVDLHVGEVHGRLLHRVGGEG